MNMKKGFTIVELLAVMAMMSVLLSVVYFSTDVLGNKMRTRDTKRLSDLNLFDRAINEYLLDNKSYPDLAQTLRVSTTIAAGGSSLESALSGWVDENFTGYLTKIPTDPINDEHYFYSYIQDGSNGYEINAVLESMVLEMQNDGGNDPNRYEMGNNLLLISP